MRNIILKSVRLLFVMTLLTGVIYPLAITGFSQIFFKKQANASLLEHKGAVVGSELLAQSFKKPQYFWPRPSAVDYNALPGGASNLGPTSKKLQDRVAEAMKNLNIDTSDNSKPYDLLLMSGSGLDPHISPESAKFQIHRVAQARGLKDEVVNELVEKMIEKPFMGLLGKNRVNVLRLNLALDGVGG